VLSSESLPTTKLSAYCILHTAYCLLTTSSPRQFFLHQIAKRLSVDCLTLEACARCFDDRTHVLRRGSTKLSNSLVHCQGHVLLARSCRQISLNYSSLILLFSSKILPLAVAILFCRVTPLL